MLLTIIALLVAPETGDTYAAASPTTAVAAAPATAASPAAAADDVEICRRRMVVGQGLIGGVKQKKVCKTRAEWAEEGVSIR